MIYGHKMIRESYLVDFYTVDTYIKDINESSILNENKFFDMIGKIFKAIKEGIKKFRKIIKEYTTKAIDIIKQAGTKLKQTIIEKINKIRKEDEDWPESRIDALVKFVHNAYAGKYSADRASKIVDYLDKRYEYMFLSSHPIKRKDKKYWDKKYLDNLHIKIIAGDFSKNFLIYFAEVAYYLKHKFKDNYKDPEKGIVVIDYRALLDNLEFYYTRTSITDILDIDSLDSDEKYKKASQKIKKYMNSYPYTILDASSSRITEKSFNKLFTKNSDGNTFRKELENIPKLTEDDLYKNGIFWYYDKEDSNYRSALCTDNSELVAHYIKDNDIDKTPDILKQNIKEFEKYLDEVESKLDKMEEKIKQSSNDYITISSTNDDKGSNNVSIKVITEYIANVRNMISDIMLSLSTVQKVVNQLSLKAISYQAKLINELLE